MITAEDLPLGLTIEDLAEFAATGNYYVNVHTVAHPDGEVRGQIELADDLVFEAGLDPEQEVADEPVESDASGQAALFYDNDTGTLDYTVTVFDIDNTIASHIHMEQAGQNGPIVAPLETPTVDAPSIGAITTGDLAGPLADQSIDQLVYALLTGHAYVNVHTSDYQGGEIRGQVSLLSPHGGDILFYTELSGDAGVPPVETDGSGMAAFRWREGAYFSYTLAVADLEHVTAAHIHLGRANATGDVVVTLYAGDEPTEGEVNAILAEGGAFQEDIGGPLAGRIMRAAGLRDAGGQHLRQRPYQRKPSRGDPRASRLRA